MAYLTRGQSRFATMENFKGTAKVKTATSDRLCNSTTCRKFYINAGDDYVQHGTFYMHPECAQAWCDANGVEADYVSS